jgi:NADH-quinone oxidoreductase subunit L
MARPHDQTERYWAHHGHHLAGNLALGLVILAAVFAALVYYYGKLDPAEAREQFPRVYDFLANKWYFDELYSAVLVRPALVVAGWCSRFDLRAIDGLINWTGRSTVRLSDLNGKFDLGIIDGLVNLTARVIYGVAGSLRGVQTGYLRSYVLFLALAVLGIFVVLSYFVSRALAG